MTDPTGDALRASEKVVNQVAAAICETVFGPYEQDEADRSDHSISGQSVFATRAAIAAYEKAMEGGK